MTAVQKYVLNQLHNAYLMFMWPCIMKNSVIKPNRCTIFSNLFLEEWKSTCFGQFLCTSSGVFNCTHSNGICHTVLQTSCSEAVSKRLWRMWYTVLCVQWKTPADGQWNCPKHVEFHSKNKFEKLMHLVGFVTWIRTAKFARLICDMQETDCPQIRWKWLLRTFP
jgi:hypothetical protein